MIALKLTNNRFCSIQLMSRIYGESPRLSQNCQHCPSASLVATINVSTMSSTRLHTIRRLFMSISRISLHAPEPAILSLPSGSKFSRSDRRVQARFNTIMTALAAPDFEYLEFLQIQKYINAACVAIWVYEFIRSIGLEVSLVWKEAWNIPKGLYLLARYFTFVMLVLLNYYNQTDCVMYQKLLTWTVNVSMLIAEVIFALRTWAVWDRSRRMAIFLTSFFLVIWISTFAIIGFWTSRTVYPSAPQELLSCRDIYNEEEQWLFRSVNFVLIVVFYSVTLVLTSIRAYQYFSGNLEMGLMRIVHFDGLIYYFFLFGVSVKVLILNVVTKTLMSHAGVVSGLQPTVCTLMACRMLLHLRQEGKRTRQLGQLGQLASQAYTSGFTVQLDTLVFRHEDMSPDTEVPNDYRGKLPS